MPDESPLKESSPELERNGRAREPSPVRQSEHRQRRSRSPLRGESRRRLSSREHHEHESRRHRHHHHRHHRRHQSPEKEAELEKNETVHRDRSTTPKAGDRARTAEDMPREIPTGPRAYRSRPRYRHENNYGRLGYVLERDDDKRDDEDRLRAVERRREEARGREEPKVTFKGRGVMKFREHYY